jgi:folate-binding protein YgfZ
MTLNPDEQDTALNWSHFLVSGPDAVNFLQGQITADMKNLSTDGFLTLLLAPDGVVIAPLWLRPVDGGIDVVTFTNLIDTVLQRLRRFKIRIDCSFSEPTPINGPFKDFDELWAAGIPGPNEMGRGLLPHSFGQELVNRTVSFSKGCFTGQELVGRLDVRGGNTPFRIVRFSAPSRDVAEEFLTSESHASSGVTSSSTTMDGVHGYAIVHRTHLDVELPDTVVINAL